MKIHFLRLLTVVVALTFGLAVTGRAEELAAVKARIAQRLSKVDQLKASGAVGENNRGLLESRGGGDSAGVVSAENSDREAVYAAIAKQTGASADQVGRSRAKQIEANSAPGVWLQHDDGSWYKK